MKRTLLILAVVFTTSIFAQTQNEVNVLREEMVNQSVEWDGKTYFSPSDYQRVEWVAYMEGFRSNFYKVVFDMSTKHVDGWSGIDYFQSILDSLLVYFPNAYKACKQSVRYDTGEKMQSREDALIFALDHDMTVRCHGAYICNGIYEVPEGGDRWYANGDILVLDMGESKKVVAVCMDDTWMMLFKEKGIEYVQMKELEKYIIRHYVHDYIRAGTNLKVHQ